jgi:hypothetical protein
MRKKPTYLYSYAGIARDHSGLFLYWLVLVGIWTFLVCPVVLDGALALLGAELKISFYYKNLALLCDGAILPFIADLG